MTRLFVMLSLACLAATLPTMGCTDKKPAQGDNALCRKLHERNRKCATALVKALHAQMGDKVPAKLKQKLAKQLGAEITKSGFRGKCREQAEAKTTSARTLKKRLEQCHAKADCSAYATCVLQVMQKVRPPN